MSQGTTKLYKHFTCYLHPQIVQSAILGKTEHGLNDDDDDDDDDDDGDDDKDHDDGEEED